MMKAMKVEIRRLSPELAEDYAHFFDVTPHDDGTIKHELPCYCVTWRSDNSYAGNGDHWFPSREERRERAIQFVKSGSIRGYLAYLGDRVVGWCNSNEATGGCLDYLREFWPIDEHSADIKVKPVFCFVIAPDVQRIGIATQLLERVCKDAGLEAFDFVEAYVHENFAAVAHDFRGPIALYEKCGFTRHAEQDGKVVMRLALR